MDSVGEVAAGVSAVEIHAPRARRSAQNSAPSSSRPSPSHTPSHSNAGASSFYARNSNYNSRSNSPIPSSTPLDRDAAASNESTSDARNRSSRQQQQQQQYQQQQQRREFAPATSSSSYSTQTLFDPTKSDGNAGNSSTINSPRRAQGGPRDGNNRRNGRTNEWNSNSNSTSQEGSGHVTPNEYSRGSDKRREMSSMSDSYAALSGKVSKNSDVIPTAVVIKNISFNIPQAELLSIMEALELPPPAAFNYHVDNGQFRGLAFANFVNHADAALTVSAMDGYCLQGRNLRAEFKKVIREGEKEVAEKGKAIQRIKLQRDASQQQLEAEGLARKEEDARESNENSSEDEPVELNYNNPSTLESYSRALLFREDSQRDELRFPRSLLSSERVALRLICERLGLRYATLGKGSDKFAIVTKVSNRRPPYSHQDSSESQSNFSQRVTGDIRYSRHAGSPAASSTNLQSMATATAHVERAEEGGLATRQPKGPNESEGNGFRSRRVEELAVQED